jgi:hypothetical protein
MSSNTESSADEVEKGGFQDAGIIAELEKELEPEKEIIGRELGGEKDLKKIFEGIWGTFEKINKFLNAEI